MNYEGLSKLGYGMYLINTGGNALLASLVMQAAPETVCVSIGKKNYTHDLMAKESKFNISVISKKADLRFLSNFGFKSGKTENKLVGVRCEDIGGVPTVVENCNAVIECEVINSVDCGDATVFFGKVLDTNSISIDPAMTYEHYQNVIEGRVAENSPAFAARYIK